LGWDERHDAVSDRPYWVNLFTRAVVWSRPEGNPPPPPTAKKRREAKERAAQEAVHAAEKQARDAKIASQIAADAANFREVPGSAYIGKLSQMSMQHGHSEKRLMQHKSMGLRKWRGVLVDRGHEGFHFH